MARPEVIYIGDPMCSWCWGFAPVFKALREKYIGRAAFNVMLGGLRPAEHAQDMTWAMRAELKHHWEAVNARTGQPFDFDFFKRENFRYDTEPACRATVVARQMDENKAYEVHFNIQEAFYAKNQDPTDELVLVGAAVKAGLDRARFLELYRSEKLKADTLEDFVQTRRWGVQGYPTVLLKESEEISVLTRGFMEIEIVAPRLDSWIQGFAA